MNAALLEHITATVSNSRRVRLSSICSCSKKGSTPSVFAATPLWASHRLFTGLSTELYSVTSTSTSSCSYTTIFTSVHQATPFKIFLLCGNISTCHGCWNKFWHTGAPCDSIVQHHKTRAIPVQSLACRKPSMEMHTTILGWNVFDVNGRFQPVLGNTYKIHTSSCSLRTLTLSCNL